MAVLASATDQRDAATPAKPACAIVGITRHMLMIPPVATAPAPEPVEALQTAVARRPDLAELRKTRQVAEELLRRHSEPVRRHPQGFTFLLSALDFYHGPTSEVVVAGDSRKADTASLARAFRRSFQPRAVLLLRPTELADSPVLRLAPFTGPYGAAPDGRALAYVCRNFTCRLPVADPEAMLALLRER